ncbi:MAG TPA: phasin family protein [Salinarimonas sp.]|nr:phasin family protein [Salinarimonas sp.]
MKDVKVKPARARGRRPAAVASTAKAKVEVITAAPSDAPAPEASVAKAPVKAPAAKAAAPKAPEVVARRPEPEPAIVAAPAPVEAPVPTLVETVVEPLAALDIAPAPSPEILLKPVSTVLVAGAGGARTAYAKAQETGETLRGALTESAAAATRGLVELNGQMLDLVRAQSDATLAMLRSTMAAPSVSEAVRAQASGARQVYETSAAHWRAIAETAGRTAEAAMKPMQAALTPRA